MSTFAHKHYAKIAGVIRECRAWAGGSIGTVRHVERGLADMFARDNPRFKPERFERACDPAQVPHGKDRQ